ncbi:MULTISPECIES: aldose epimerase family protein [unclassified Streptomyces]|uniref:aldose epimerase family protein n=1 Tax=unclassified Streptomyces TaxID=2593676 RepID=UPI002E2D05E4|nr:aldose epimerase family protein [Streptomyces sp. NBC_00223]
MSTAVTPPTREPFGTAPDGRAVELWRLTSAAGVSAEILTYGGVLHALHVPDRAGRTASVVLSLPDAAAYATRSPYFGALVGRYANRIAEGRFTLDGRVHHLPVNDRGHTLHGGPDGFHRRIWRAEPLSDGSLRLSLNSPDGDMGFPGAVEVTATYALDAAGTLALDFEARTDRPTVVNLTNHAYFNLAAAQDGPDSDGGGSGDGSVLRHVLRVDADRYLPVSPEGIPWGPELDVSGTPFDFTVPRPVGDGIDRPDPQLKAAGGYDHCWVLRSPGGSGAPRTAAVLHEPDSGRTLEVRTTEPGVQVYTANGLEGAPAGPDGHRQDAHSAICLETQHLPDSPNRPEYPSTVLRPGEVFRSRTEFRFPHLDGRSAG